MYRSISSEEAKINNEKAFKKLENGSVFDIWRERILIVDKKLEDSLVVVELTKTNIDLILWWKVAEKSVLKFEDLSCVNIHNEFLSTEEIEANT